MRQNLTLIHRWMGLATAAPLAVIGITGSILAFGHEIDAVLNPDLFRSAQTGRPLDLDRVAQRVATQSPGAEIYFLAPSRGQSSVMLRLIPARGSPPLRFDQAFADPATGRVLGVRSWDSCGLSRAQLVPCVHRIHTSMLIPGATGILVVGGVALLLFLQQIIGLPLTFPKGRRPWKRWGASWRIDRRTATTSFGLHRLSGLWTWPLLVVVAITGASISLENELFKPLIAAFGTLTPTVAESGRLSGSDSAVIGYDAALAQAERFAKAQEAGSAAVPAGISHNAEMGYYGVALESNAQASGFGPSWYYVDDRNGALLVADTMAHGTIGDAVMHARLPLHGGRAFGMVGRLMIAVGGLVVAALSVTGFMIWLRRNRRKSSGT